MRALLPFSLVPRLFCRHSKIRHWREFNSLIPLDWKLVNKRKIMILKPWSLLKRQTGRFTMKRIIEDVFTPDSAVIQTVRAPQNYIGIRLLIFTVEVQQTEISTTDGKLNRTSYPSPFFIFQPASDEWSDGAQKEVASQGKQEITSDKVFAGHPK